MKKKMIWIWIVLVSIGYYGCSDMNSLHDPYLKRGETIYVSTADSVKVFPGKNRVKISYYNYDPKVAKLTVYWDFRAGSASFDVPTGKLGEEIEVIVDNLEEKQYTFELVTSNREGRYPSVPVYISGPVYGTSYTASLSNRKITNASIIPFAGNMISINWANAPEGMVGVELSYRNSSNVETVLKIPNSEASTRLMDAASDEVMYRTLHLPAENCIDTFYTNYTAVNLPEIEDEKLDRLKFKRWNPPGIPYLNEYWPIENMWNGNFNELSAYLTTQTIPFSITFDLGQTAYLSRIRIFQELGEYTYYWYNPRKFSIWGSPHPDVTDDFSGWIFLGEFESIKPSGLPIEVWNFSDEDLEYARAGEFFRIEIPDNVPIRYFRFHTTETWAGGDYFILNEIELFGAVIE